MINIICALMITNALHKIQGELKMHIPSTYYSTEFKNPADTGMSILSNEGDRIFITPEEIQLLNRCVMSEAGDQSCECQEAVDCDP